MGACSLLLGPSNVSFSLQDRVLMWKFDPLGSRAHFYACSLLLGSSDVSFSLKKKLLMSKFDVEGTLACSLLLRSREGLNLEC